MKKEKKFWFYIKIFLLTNLNMDIILRMPFLILNNMKINFLKLELFWRIYFSIKAILIIKSIKLVKKKKFLVATFDLKKKLT